MHGSLAVTKDLPYLPQLLSKPHDGDTLYVFLVVSKHTVSVVLVCEEVGRQSPVYYVSKALLDAETWYN